MSIVRRLNRQSNFDMCLKIYGNLDNLVKLCRDNSITEITTPKDGDYIFDENLVQDVNNIGYDYVTQST